MANPYKQHVDIINNSVDLTTLPVNKENPAYLIDRKLLDTLLSKITKVNLDDMKSHLNHVITFSNTKEEIFAALEEYIYIDKIANMVEATDNVVERGREVGKILLDKEGYL